MLYFSMKYTPIETKEKLWLSIYIFTQIGFDNTIFFIPLWIGFMFLTPHLLTRTKLKQSTPDKTQRLTGYKNDIFSK